MRLDIALLQLNIFKTRSKVQEAIKSGIIYYDGKCINKPGKIIDDINLIEIRGEVIPYVSRGGLKLEKAIKEFNIDLNGKVLLDIGSSTGGFTDCALQNGAIKVIAIDVGSNVMDSELRKDSRITLYEKTDFRNIDNSLLESANIASIDVSFISVKLLLNKINELSNIKEVICLIKPEFECGRDIANKYKGVIKDKKVHEEVIRSIINSFIEIGFYLNNLSYSPITGGDGNIEYLAYFNKNNIEYKLNIISTINEAFKKLN